MSGYFLNKLPAARPSLVDLANAAIVASQVERAANDADWNAANDADIEAKEAFRARLFAETGLTDALLDQLQSAGVL